MDVLWDHGPARVREVMERLPKEFAYTSIATVLYNLDRKKLLRISKDGCATRYAAQESSHEHAATQMACLLEASPDRATTLQHLAKALSGADRELLRESLTSFRPR